jgi:diguanylate cyclase (GGDEF)-like protein
LEPQILIVDDDTLLLNSLGDFLEIAGFRSVSVTNAEAALELIQQNGFEIIIIDIVLPGMNGLELTGAIKKKHDVDVILMTGYQADHSYEMAIHSGASDFVIKPFRYEEILLRIRRVLRERELNRERNRIMEKLKTLATTDGLTKLFNSRHFYNQLQLEVDRTLRYAHPLSLLFIDIDNFKEYNDRYGHLEGDKVLARLGEIIKSCLRKMDSAYRYGGEEFTVILPETGAEEARVVAERIRSAIERESFRVETGQTGKVTVSIGVTEYQSPESITEFIKRSDKAMYDAKDHGRNRVSIHTLPPMSDADPGGD